MTLGPTVDLNADLGESYGAWRLGDDQALLTVVTSANIACGFHAGDPRTIERTVLAAVEHGVAVGAQVSYPDLVGFGRRAMEVAPEDLAADVIYQVGALEAFCQVAGTTVRYVKPHGALYNRVLVDPVQASGVVDAVRRYDSALPLLTLPDGELARAAERAGLVWVGEGFADRAYTAEGRLVPRSRPGAVLHEPAAVAAQAARLAGTGPVRSICVHGDTPGAVTLARAVRQALLAAGLTVAAFA
jgi:UPF0271 protein